MNDTLCNYFCGNNVFFFENISFENGIEWSSSCFAAFVEGGDRIEVKLSHYYGK